MSQQPHSHQLGVLHHQENLLLLAHAGVLPTMASLDLVRRLELIEVLDSVLDIVDDEEF